MLQHVQTFTDLCYVCCLQAIQQQLHQAHIFVQHCVPDAAPLLPGRLAAAAQAAASQTADDVRVSQLQRDVGHMLGALQASSSSEVGFEDACVWRCDRDQGVAAAHS